MQPELHIGPVTLQTFGIMFALGFVAAGLVIRRRLTELGRPADWAYELVLVTLVGGMVGARVYFMVQHWDEVQTDFFSNLVSGSGLVWYGGAIGGAVAGLMWAAYRRFLSLDLVDLVAPALAVGYAIGRVGCQLSGDGDYGIPSNLPWAMSYPEGTVPTTVEVHPAPIYETLAMGLAAWFLWRLRNSVRPGALFAIYLVLAGTERFFIEFIRRNSEAAAGLTMPQFESLVVVVAGVAFLMIRGVRLAPAGAKPG